MKLLIQAAAAMLFATASLAQISDTLDPAALAVQLSDADRAVRLEAVSGLGQLWQEPRIGALAGVAERDGGDPEFQEAILSAAEGIAAPLLEVILTGGDGAAAEEKAPLMKALAQLAASEGIATLQVIASMNTLPDMARVNLAAGFAAGAAQGKKWSLLNAVLFHSGLPDDAADSLLASAQQTATDANAELESRRIAVAMLSASTFEISGEFLLELVTPMEPISIQAAAIRSLANLGDPAMVPLLLEGWGSYTPAIRQQIMYSDIKRDVYLLALLNAVEEGIVEAGVLEPWGLRGLLQDSNVLVRARALQVLPPKDRSVEEDVLVNYQHLNAFVPNVEKGQTLYQENCSICHRFDGQGNQIGPDLDVKAQAGAYTVLKKLLHPNAEALTFYYRYDIATMDFEDFGGIITEEDDEAITIVMPGGLVNTITRDNIDSLECTEKTLMLEGWKDTLGEQGLADVIGYLTQTAQAE